MNKYSEYRQSIRTGDVLVWSRRYNGSLRDIAPWFIRLFTQSEYNHVGIAYVINDRVMVMEAVTPLIRMVPLSEHLPCYLLHMDGLSAEAESKAFSLIGKGRYSVLESIKSYFGINSNKNRWQCVEYAKEVLRANGIEVPGRDTPSEFVLELQKMGRNLVYIEQG